MAGELLNSLTGNNNGRLWESRSTGEGGEGGLESREAERARKSVMRAFLWGLVGRVLTHSAANDITEACLEDSHSWSQTVNVTGNLSRHCVRQSDAGMRDSEVSPCAFGKRAFYLCCLAW